MKVFLSWSGQLSKQVALALRDWLPNVIQAIDPWMSSEDIEKGTRWSSDLAKELAITKAGIVCVTPDNLHAPWLNFEAGALSKVVEKEMVCPFLFRLKYSDLTGPLVQFQLSEATKEDTRKLLSTLNKAVDPKPLSELKLTEAFEVWWGKFESRLKEISLASPVVSVHRSSNDMIEEVLEIVREQARTTQDVLSTVQRAEILSTVQRAEMSANRAERNQLHYIDLFSSGKTFDNLSTLEQMWQTKFNHDINRRFDGSPQADPESPQQGQQDE
jgi:hypothetical protein